MTEDQSGDDEFYDAIGDQGQIEAIKSNIEHPSPIYYEKSSVTHPMYTKGNLSSILPLKTDLTMNLNYHGPDENENTLTIIEKELKDTKSIHNNVTSSRNLQQILDRLDENSQYISAEINASEIGRGKDESEFKEDDLESPTNKVRNAFFESPQVNRSGISRMSTPNAKISNDDSEGSNNVTPRSMMSNNSSKSSKGNFASRLTFSSPARKSFFAILNRKKTIETEFSYESIRQHNKNNSNFEKLACLQYIEDKKADPGLNSKKSKNVSATWVAKFSPNDKLLATGGSDGILRVFHVKAMGETNSEVEIAEDDIQLLNPEYISLIGHKLDIIDIAWYKDSNLVLTSAIDKIVILWNIESESLVKVFGHSDIVPCISFHPLVNEFFTTGCFDKILRIWDINETKVVDWVQTNDLITALTFSPDKNHLLVGFYKGTVKIYRTDQGKLKFAMEITCKNTFVWGKLNKVGKKVTGIIFTEDYEFLVMTNDSRMRLVDLKTYETKIKYKGHSSGKYHIQPSYNYEKELILSGSEDEKVYVWNKVCNDDMQSQNTSSAQKADRNTSYEYFKPFPKANTTCAVWMPFSVTQKYKEKLNSVWKDTYVDNLMVLFSSDFRIKVLANLIDLESTLDKKK